MNKINNQTENQYQTFYNRSEETTTDVQPHHMLKDYFEQSECLKPKTSHGNSVNEFHHEPAQNTNTHVYST